jgi:hypothetical protein
MGNFKPQVRFETRESRHDYNMGRFRCISPEVTKRFNTYSELKKALKDYILHDHIGDDAVFVVRSRRGEWGEWFEHWRLVNGVPTIVKEGWS